MARILLDMDGILCNLLGKWLDVYNREYDDSVTVDALTRWGPHKVAKAGRAIYKYLSKPGFFRDLDPIPGALKGVNDLLKRGHEIIVVTAARRGHDDKRAWLKQHLPNIHQDHIIFAHRKELVRGDVLFDDAPHHLRAFARYGTPVAMAYPYNARVRCARVSAWSDFVSLIDDLYPPKKSQRPNGYSLAKQ